MYNRIPVELEANIRLNGTKYRGIIQNLSIRGIMVSTNRVINVSSHETVEIKYKLPSKRTLSLSCVVKWCTINNGSEKFKFSMGLEIINPPVTYDDFLHSLYKSSVVFIG